MLGGVGVGGRGGRETFFSSVKDPSLHLWLKRPPPTSSQFLGHQGRHRGHMVRVLEGKMARCGWGQGASLELGEV